jgi:hypothetical protein
VVDQADIARAASATGANDAAAVMASDADAARGAGASSADTRVLEQAGGSTPRRVECPRCGYDLSGAVAAWTDTCPVVGTCPECGLVFAWRDVFVESRRRERRLFEHAESRLFRSLIGTLALTLLPSRLWRRVRMEMSIDFRRIAAMVLWGLLLMYASRTALAVAHRMIEHFINNRRFAWVAAQGAWFEQPDEWLRVLWPRTLLGEAQVDLSVFNLGYVPSVAWLMLLAYVLAPMCFTLLPQTVRRCRVRREHLQRVTLYLLPTLVLTQSASVNLIDAWGALTDYMAWTRRPFPAWFSSHYQGHNVIASWRLVPAAVVGALWMFWWWRCAAKWYLRMPHASGVAAAIVALSLLIATGIFVALGGGPSLLDDLAVVTKPILPW